MSNVDENGLVGLGERALNAVRQADIEYQGVYGITRGFLDEFGSDRVIDTPIAETAIIGAAMGAAAKLAPALRRLINCLRSMGCSYCLALA